MKIAKRDKSAETFLQRAPDAARPVKAATDDQAPRRDVKAKISHTIPEGMLARLDDKAAQLGQSRAALINLAIAKLLEG